MADGQPNRIAVFLLTHIWTPTIRQRFLRLRREIGDAVDVYVMMQNGEAVSAAVADGPQVRSALAVFDHDSLPGMVGVPFAFNNAITPGSTHFPLLAFAQVKSGYEHYLVVEHDVEFSGDWSELVALVRDRQPDFASSNIQRYEKAPDWIWWDRLEWSESDAGWASDASNLVRSFNPVYCLSRAAIEDIIAAQRDGWCGHYELTLATILSQRSRKLLDWKDCGLCDGTLIDFDENRPALDHSTMRFRPDISIPEFRARSTDRTLFHPVKADWYFDGDRIVESDAG